MSVISRAITMAAFGLASLSIASAAELAPPVLLTAAGKPIDVEHGGHAAPWMADILGQGRKDLLVGEAFEGRLRIYPNVGTQTEPRFEKHEWFQAGREIGRVPSG